jgi:hypothetical protein
MAVVPPAAGTISMFDEVAGGLYVHESKDGRLSKELLIAIAEKIDVAGLGFNELQPAQKQPIMEFNQHHPRDPIKTFAKACADPRFSRSIRKRLYVARDRYKLAHSLPPVS